VETLFTYRALTSEGTVQAGEMTAKSESEALAKIRALGHTPIKVEEKAQTSRKVGGSLTRQKVKLDHLKIFCKQLETMLNAGLSLHSSLDILAEQTESKQFAEIIKEVNIAILKGSSLSEAMKKYPKVFPELMVSLTAAGEKSGRLDEVMGRLAVQYEREAKVKNKMRNAMIYPAILGIITVIAMAVIMIFVVPTFVDIFESNNVPLPMITKIVIAISSFLAQYWWLLLTLIILATIALRSYYKTPGGRRFFDQRKMSFFLIKKSIVRINAALFTRTLSTLLASGVPLIESLVSAGATTSNMIIVDAMEEITSELRKGGSLSKLLEKSKLFPSMMTSMIAVGEESGALDDMLLKTADFYDEELEDAMQRLVASIEPVMIVVMGAIIGFLVAAVMLPIFGMSSTVQ
jgi:type IV pilus assembly protein PilC